MLGNMLVLGDVEILEHWLEMDSLNADGLSILLQNILDIAHLSIVDVEVLSSGEDSVINSDWGDLSNWILLNTIGGKGTVNSGAESLVVEHVFGVIGLILHGK